MPWYAFFLEFFSGMLLTNAFPHLIQGLSGNPFQTPFASPPGVGESSAQVNVYWGLFCLFSGLALLAHFMPASPAGWVVVAAGATLMGTRNARHFSRVRSLKGN